MRRFSFALLILPLLLSAQTQPLINRERATELFLQLVHIDSGSENEAEICRFVVERLRELGAEEVFVDNASEKIGGTGGNVFARFKGTVNASPVMLSAHLDTVAPTKGIKVIRTETEIKTDGTTILGADDKAGVALILEAIQTLRERNLPHPPIEVVFTIREEKGLLGAKVFDKSKLKSHYGIVVDGSGEPGDLIVGSPTHFRFEAVFHGKAAHAGVEPEKGVNAIVMASEAISAMKWGRIDEDTTANVGVIEGGQAMNIVPDRCKVVGEFRSHNPQKVEALVAEWKRICEQVAQKFGGKVDLTVDKTFDAIRLSPDEPIVKAAMKAVESLGLKPKLKRMGGGTDGNIFTAHGIRCLVLPTGGENYHSPNERLVLANFYAVGEILVRTIVELAR
ncbi:MAG: M20/M25/M40 family metallo-hydrolase [Armatimonadota bacterium]|nr:M20/M25/M40 family metallo-hydrolase [Armatimonadota bacterium]MDW8142285.1 M20/M25/M40 family metallo-hydrolase [Armatimonadota bacterium]